MPWAGNIPSISSLRADDDKAMHRRARQALIDILKTTMARCPRCGKDGSLQCFSPDEDYLPRFYCRAKSHCPLFETRLHWSVVQIPDGAALHVVIGAWLQWETYAGMDSVTRLDCPAPKSHTPATEYRRIVNFQSKLPIVGERNGYLYTHLKDRQSGLYSKIVPVVRRTLVNGQMTIAPSKTISTILIELP